MFCVYFLRMSLEQNSESPRENDFKKENTHMYVTITVSTTYYMQPQDAYPGGAFPKINPCVCRTNAYQYTAFAYEQKCTVLNDLCACGKWGRAENEV